MVNKNLPTQEKLRFYELDLLRFMAALSVVFFHYTFLNSIHIPSISSYPVLGGVFKYGYLGVELFFIISGFVILLSTANKTSTEFVVSRIARLYPAFWVAVIFTSLALFLFGSGVDHEVGLVQFLVNLTMVPEYLGVENIDSVYWTLQIEIKFYFWVFVLIKLNKIMYIERFIMAWLCLAVLEMFHFIHGFTHQFLIPEWAPYFSAGALFYRIRIYGFNWPRGVMLSLAYLLSIYYAIDGATMRTEAYDTYFSPIVVAIIVTLFYLVFTLLVTKVMTVERIENFGRSSLSIMGAMTYPLYLIHDAVGQLAFYYFGQSVNKYVLLTLVTLFMLVTSYLIYRYFELGISRKIKSWLTNKCYRIDTKQV